jgi:protein involved in polysaccharide export with SLBB domain
MPIVLLVLALIAAFQQPGAPMAQQPAVPSDLQRIDVIQPHDVLTVVVTHEPELSGDYAVDANGRIEVPLIGFVDAADTAERSRCANHTGEPGSAQRPGSGLRAS